ncbi:MAG TPA: ABC transporter substrate-binding protein [Eoetvoesiella sp.]|uniref:ABC transporter substrate-binding protein n=1 Tax=Eoetvoesiella sp. TaxID=1966355 RepID=UPI002C8A2C4D|nr:ABC transporter substrate-binding protein [Eoetvoesiella sp.]HWK59865.1 ABC transporter substrate-binding protein [Eoetvoesiella sp.]
MRKALLAVLIAAWSGAACAEVVVGISVSSTGPGASLGTHIAKVVPLLPKTVAGEAVRYIMLDDASDPTVGARNARKLISDDKVDVIIGSSTVPVAIAQSSVANEVKVPIITICPIPLDPAKLPYTFAVPQPIPLMVDALLDHMHAHKVKKLGYIGFADAWGDMNYNYAKSGGAPRGITVTTNERYSRNDTSVNSQALKVVTSQPDAIFVGASGSPAAIAQIAAVKRGYRHQIYHTHGVVNLDFIRVAGKSAEGVIAPTGPVVVAEQLPADSPLKATGMDFIKRYEGAYGAGSRNAFAAYAWDAGLIIQAAIPVALKTGKPGTPEFRQALRNAIESNKEVKGTHAVYNMSATDHYGVDKRARVLVQVEHGEWKLLNE